MISPSSPSPRGTHRNTRVTLLSKTCHKTTMRYLYLKRNQTCMTSVFHFWIGVDRQTVFNGSNWHSSWQLSLSIPAGSSCSKGQQAWLHVHRTKSLQQCAKCNANKDGGGHCCHPGICNNGVLTLSRQLSFLGVRPCCIDHPTPRTAFLHVPAISCRRLRSRLRWITRCAARFALFCSLGLMLSGRANAIQHVPRWTCWGFMLCMDICIYPIHLL